MGRPVAWRRRRWHTGGSRGGGIGGGSNHPSLNAPPISDPDPFGSGTQNIPSRSTLGGTPQPAPPPGYEQCIMEALQEVIHAGETPRDSNNGYGALAHGKVYSAPYPLNIFVGQRNVNLDPSSLSGHPGVQVQWNPAYKTSSAFGRYQITIGTAATYGITDFSRRGQDSGAETIMQALGMVAPAMQGNLALSMALGHSTWVSLPGAMRPVSMRCLSHRRICF